MSRSATVLRALSRVGLAGVALVVAAMSVTPTIGVAAVVPQDACELLTPELLFDNLGSFESLDVAPPDDVDGDGAADYGTSGDGECAYTWGSGGVTLRFVDVGDRDPGAVYDESIEVSRMMYATEEVDGLGQRALWIRDSRVLTVQTEDRVLRLLLHLDRGTPLTDADEAERLRMGRTLVEEILARMG